jgi:hypothetical protein
MARPLQLQERDNELDQLPQPQEAAPKADTPKPTEEEQQAAYTSPETAGARESVRRDAAKLESQVTLPSPAQEVEAAGGGVVGPDLINHVAAQEQKIKGEALDKGYQAVVAGGAAATGQPKAKAAVEQAPPEMRQAATEVSQQKGAGSPLPEATRQTMETKFGADFSDVQVHTDSKEASALGAGAATAGDTIHFAPGQFDPESPQGQSLIAHELTHVVQQRNAPQTEAKDKVAPSDAAAEQQAEKVGAQVKQGDAAPVAPVQEGTAAAEVHLGEAGVHRGIELDAAGVGQEFDPKNLTPQQQAALQMYSGNFMRDYSQLAAPMPLKILSNLPSTHEGGKVGAGGARTLMDALVQSIAILELGKDIGKSLVKSNNIGVYEAEHHIDNPMGTSGPGDFISGGAEPHVAAHVTDNPKCMNVTDARGDQNFVSNGAYSDDPETQNVHAGSAVPGLQYENPTLYQVGEGGLGNHIANSTEHCKDRLLDAAGLGATPLGRMNMGMGQHVVEDYFSHTNYIEVALNRYINDAIGERKAHKAKTHGNAAQTAAVNQFFDGFVDKDGKPKEGATVGEAGVHGEFAFVDTLYDQKTPDGKQAVTTGTFGGTDTRVSIGHVLLPKLPILEKAMHKGVDSTFGIIDEAQKQKKAPTWQTIKGMLDGKGNEGAIAQVMLEASNSVGLAVPCPSGFHMTYKPVGLPLIGNIDVPNGMELTYTNIGITDALVTGASTYVAVMDQLDQIKKATGFLHLEAVITAMQDKIKHAMAALGAAVRQQMSTIIKQIIMNMYDLDPQKLGHASVDELTGVAEEKMHEMSERTSLESRMQKGGDLNGLTEAGDNGKAELERRIGPVQAKNPSAPKATWGTKENPWVNINPLPPSHSEISKDHPPHDHGKGDKGAWHDHDKEHKAVDSELMKKIDDDHDHDEHEDLSGGSSFYELHRRLAVEADRHLMFQMERVWKTGELIPGQKVDEHDQKVGHDRVLGEAEGVADDAAKASKKAGFRHMQSDDRKANAMGNPDVKALMNLVDYFISHPTASSWWHDIFDSYVAQHPDDVKASILARNKTRGHRQAPEDK